MKHSFLLAALLIITSSAFAQNSFFFPDKVNSPGRMNSTQLKTTLAFKPSVNMDNFPAYKLTLNPSLDVAYSPAKNLVVAAAFRTLINRSSNDLDNWGFVAEKAEYDGGRLEACIGYSMPFNGKGLFEAYAGYGIGTLKRSQGRVTANYDYWNYGLSKPTEHATDFTARYSAYTLQLALGMEDEHFSFRGGLKYTVQDFNSFSYKDKVMDTLLVSNPSSSQILNNIYAFMQPYVDIEAGGKMVRFSGQAGISQQMVDGLSFEGDIRGYASFGIALKFGLL